MPSIAKITAFSAPVCNDPELHKNPVAPHLRRATTLHGEHGTHALLLELPDTFAVCFVIRSGSQRDTMTRSVVWWRAKA